VPDEESFEEEVERRYQEARAKAGTVGGTRIFAPSRKAIAAKVLVERELAQRIAAVEGAAPEESHPPSPPDGTTVEPDLSGKPLSARAVERALRRYAEGASIRDVEGDEMIGFSFRHARRVWTWHASGALRWDLPRRQPALAPGYRLVGEGPGDRRLVRLIRA